MASFLGSSLQTGRSLGTRPLVLILYVWLYYNRLLAIHHALELHYLQYTVVGSQWQMPGHDILLTLTYLPPHTKLLSGSHKASYHNGWLPSPCTRATVPAQAQDQ